MQRTVCNSMTNIPLFVDSIIITIISECLLSSRLRGRVPWRDFQGQCRAEHERDRVKANGDVCGRRGGRRWENGEPAASPKREAKCSLSLFGTRSKTRDTTMVARYISKVKDLLFSALLESIHIRDYTTFHRPLLTPSAVLVRAYESAGVRVPTCNYQFCSELS